MVAIRIWGRGGEGVRPLPWVKKGKVGVYVVDATDISVLCDTLQVCTNPYLLNK